MFSAGMHARPATAFVDIASQFKSDIGLQRGIKIANGKSMASILKLGAALRRHDPYHRGRDRTPRQLCRH